jgi:polysaccharide export outer membrane protein
MTESQNLGPRRQERNQSPQMSAEPSTISRFLDIYETSMLRSILTVSASFLALVAQPIQLNAQTFPVSSSTDEERTSRDDRQSDSRQDSQDEYDSEQSDGIEPTRITDEALRNRTQSREKSEKSKSLLDRDPAETRKAEPNEFELYVARMLGRPLQRFGADLVLPDGRDFDRSADATIPPDYRINVGDTISISLTGSAEGSVERTVDNNGRIFLSSVGEITLAGVRQGDLKAVLTRAIGTQFRNFRVGVRTTELRGVRVFVTGYAVNPGAFSVNSLTTAFNAILQAGGPAAGGSWRNAKLVRDGVEIADIDLYDILINGNRAKDVTLENEDVIVIPPAAPQIAVAGSVRREAIFELRGSETIEDALRYAGGKDELAEISRVMIYSTDMTGLPGPREILAKEFGSTVVRAGDVIQVLAEGNLMRPTDRQSVVVRVEGEVVNPGNYYVEPNKPLEDVIKLAGGYSQRAFVYGAGLTRQTVMVQQKRSFEEALDLFEIALASTPLQSGNGVDPGRAAAQLLAAQATLAKLREAKPDGRLVLETKPDSQSLPSGILLENGDRIVIPPRPTSIGVFGAVYRPASFQIDETNPRKIRDYVELAGGTIQAANRGDIFVVRANGSVLTRAQGAFNQKALPGDVVFVPIRTQSSDIFTKITQISTLVFQLGLAAATVAAIN